MKRIVPALALGLLAFGGCTDFRSDVFIQGRIAPGAGTCLYTPGGGTTFISSSEVFAKGQQVVNGKLELVLGFQMINDTATPDVPNANGESTSQPNRDDAVVQSVDIDITDLNNGSIASESLVASGYIPGGGGNGVVLVDIMGQPLADAIRKKMAFPKPLPGRQQWLLHVVVHGKLVSGTEFVTEPYQHEFDVDYTDFFASLPDASGTVTTVAVFEDGGFSDETIAADGTQTLLNDGNAQYFAVVFGTYPDGGPIPDPNNPDGGTLSGLANADGGLFPICE